LPYHHIKIRNEVTIYEYNQFGLALEGSAVLATIKIYQRIKWAAYGKGKSEGERCVAPVTAVLVSGCSSVKPNPGNFKHLTPSSTN
jgi:hypothetical protein